MGSGSSQVFGLRLQRHSFDFFFQTLRRHDSTSRSDVAAFERSFGSTRFIHLHREDKVGQAISYLRAQQSGLWHVAADGSELERTGPHRDPRYDAEAIGSQVETFAEFERGWVRWFDREGIEPLVLTYAELAREPVDVTRTVLSHLGLDASAADGIEPGVQRMADATTEDWALRFRVERDTG